MASIPATAEAAVNATQAAESTSSNDPTPETNPTTPPRPQRSSLRMTLPSPDSPRIAYTPRPSQSHPPPTPSSQLSPLSSPLSANFSSRRKPVPSVFEPDITEQQQGAGIPLATFPQITFSNPFQHELPVEVAPPFQPRPHVLDVHLPVESGQLRISSQDMNRPASAQSMHSASQETHYTATTHTNHSTTNLIAPVPEPAYGPRSIPALGTNSAPELEERLPSYAHQPQTELPTLAARLWRWGWVFPLFWVCGMFLLCVPRTYEHEEADDQKHKIAEKLQRVRATELKYAKKCMWGTVTWIILLAIIIVVVVAIVLS